MLRPAASVRVAALLVASGALGCAPGSAPPEGEARRIVSLAPSVTELLFAIGAGPRVVGRTAWCDYPPAALAVPNVGDGLNPNVEAIAARAPDLVVLYATGANQTAAEQLERLGIAVLAFRMDRLDDVVRGARLLGPRAGVRAGADSLARAFGAALDSARAAPRPVRPVRVLLLAWDQPPIVIGGGSFQSELVTLAGGVNVFADLDVPSGQVTIETIALRDPDVVVVTGEDTAPAWVARPEWQTVRAVRERRFASAPGSAFARPSPRAFDAARELGAALRAIVQ